MFSVSTVLGEKFFDVEQPRGASAKHPGRRPPPQWTERGPVKEGIMFGELSVFFSLPGYVGVFVEDFHKLFLLELS